MIYINHQPRIPYYAWMLEVQLHQHEKLGMDLSKFHILVGYSWMKDDQSNKPEVVRMYQALQEKYPKANFFFYEDTRNPIHYIPSIIPHLLKKHYRVNSWLESETVFLHDCDMIFTKVPDYTDLCQDDINYMSDSRNFINYDYINYNRPYELYQGMCKIVGIDTDIPKQQNDNSGGSQYIYKFGSSLYWDKVERDSEELYKFFQRTEPERNKTIPGYYGIQQFTAGMWAFLWNIWLQGKETRVTNRLDFCWSTDLIHEWHETEIFHNAGCTHDKAIKHNLFYKGHYTDKLPYKDVLDREYNRDYANALYADLVREVAKNTCLVYEV